MELRWPDRTMLDSYSAALRCGWHANNLRPESAEEELAAIAADPDRFVASLVDPEGSGPPVAQPDGSVKPRLPGWRKWMWADEFVGSIGLRWQPGTDSLPSYVLGHIGFSVVPWARRRGHATAALGMVLADARDIGLCRVDLTTDVDNVASQRVIERNGGEVVSTFRYDGVGRQETAVRYRIDVTDRVSGGDAG